jgi:hypothetical protein
MAEVGKVDGSTVPRAVSATRHETSICAGSLRNAELLITPALRMAPTGERHHRSPPARQPSEGAPVSWTLNINEAKPATTLVVEQGNDEPDAWHNQTY